MLDIQIDGTLPQINENAFADVVEQISELMLASVQMNLTMGGRPEPFAVKHPNETPLVGSGKMYSGLESSFGRDFAMVSMNPSVVSSKGFFYPAALHYGADVPPFGTPKEEQWNVPKSMLKGGKGVYKYPEAGTPLGKKLRKQGLELGGRLTAVKVLVFVVDGKTIFTTTRRGFHLGPFPFMIFQDEDMEKILEIYSGAIFIQDGEKIQ